MNPESGKSHPHLEEDLLDLLDLLDRRVDLAEVDRHLYMDLGSARSQLEVTELANY